MLYAFILGKNTALSVAEIISVLKRESFVFVILSITSKALVIKLDKNIEKPQNFLDRLGGTVKIAEIIYETEKNSNIEQYIIKEISESKKESKYVFGISCYGSSQKKMGFRIKKNLKEIGISSRLVEGKEDALSSPEIKTNKILSKGSDFVIINCDKGIFLGKTIAIQDYESYSHRDFDRPRRNAKSGMLPPKVAQSMLNIIPFDKKGSEAMGKKLIYDPFCGQATILQEALLMGYRAMGSDISKDRIYDSKQNLEWLSKEYGLIFEPDKILFRADALSINKGILPSSPDAIVSEVYLGPPLERDVRENDLKDLIGQMDDDYTYFLKNLRLNLPDIEYFVLALPFYKMKDELYFLNIIDEAEKIGYNVIDALESIFVEIELPTYKKERKTILYYREDQKVGREIIILKKN